MNSYPFDQIKNQLGLVQAFTINKWGGNIEIHFLIYPDLKELCKFEFLDCNEILIQNYNSSTTKNVSDVIGFKIGLPDHQEKAILTANDFEILISYKSVHWDMLTSS